jgi:DNA-binding winged helix-turn-helix (wHTH) protein
MGCFEWVSSRALPARFDLRARGWRLRGPGCAEPGCARLVEGEDDDGLARPPLRRRTLILGVSDSDARARWLELGVGDALSGEVGLDELDARARGIVARQLAGGVPPSLVHGRLRLDPLLRDARADGRRLHLHPREFLLLWRLAAAEGASVPRETLLRDVFDLGFDPGTNRLAVHVCRLRKKLADAGLASLLATGPGDGGYALVLDHARRSFGRRNGVDAPGRLREHERALEEAAT